MPQDYPVVLKDIKCKEMCMVFKQGSNLGQDEIVRAILMKGVQHRNISDYYKQKAVLKILMCFYLHVHPPKRPQSANESKNKKTSCRETDTSSQGERQQHIKMTLCKTTFIKMLIDIIPCLTYGAIKSSLPRSIFGPFSWLNHQFRICQTPLCRLRASPWFHLLCINKRALAPVSSHTTKAFLPLHSKFCSFSHSEKNPTQQQHGLVAMQRLKSHCIGISSRVWFDLNQDGQIMPGCDLRRPSCLPVSLVYRCRVCSEQAWDPHNPLQSWCTFTALQPDAWYS